MLPNENEHLKTEFLEVKFEPIPNPSVDADCLVESPLSASIASLSSNSKM